MKNRKIILILLLLSNTSFHLFSQETRGFQVLTIAFYNLENLFDTEDDPHTFDDVRTQGIYKKKLENMANAISRIGPEQTSSPPALIGVCEVENLRVLEDLVTQPSLADKGYGIIHYDSPDRRGIDVALLYRKSQFIPLNSEARELLLYDRHIPGKRVYTRDQLVVTGLLEGEEINVIVSHWPSRSGGQSSSSYKRDQAAALNKLIIDSLQRKNPYSRIISMGDFNDDPGNNSLKNILSAKGEKDQVEWKDLYNPMAKLAKQGIGSLAYRDGWNLFDQIIVSRPFLESDYSSYRFYKAGVFNENFLITPTGQYRGYPYRSFGTGGFTGGYSDHFPVYILLIKELPN